MLRSADIDASQSPLSENLARPVESASVDEIIEQAATLAKSGQAARAVELLTDANRHERSATLERLMVRYRRRAFVALEPAEPHGEWPRPLADPFPSVVGLPELVPDELTSERVGGGILHHGAVIVRGFTSPARAATFRHSIDEAFAAYDDSVISGKTSDWFQPFSGSIEKQADRRAWIRKSGAIWAADSPPALFEVFEQMHEAGIPPLVDEHFGEPATLSINKLTLRKVAPVQAATWHQDGTFLGSHVRALNLWITFNACGGDIDDTPGLDVVPQRVDELLEPGGPGAWVEHAISSVHVKERYGDRIQRPAFEAGDALLFDERFLHKSGISRGMTNDRYTVETWFFARSTFPEHYHGLVV